VLDLYGSYVFFALSSRLPLVALVVSVVALVVFLGAMAWAAWPAAVLVMWALAGLLVGLQFVVYGCHRIALGLAWMLRGTWFGALHVSRRIRAFFVTQGGNQAGPPHQSSGALRPLFLHARGTRYEVIESVDANAQIDGR